MVALDLVSIASDFLGLLSERAYPRSLSIDYINLLDRVSEHYRNSFRLFIPSGDCNAIAFVKGRERYVFLYNPRDVFENLKIVAGFAWDPDLSYDWSDCLVASEIFIKEYEKEVKDYLELVELPVCY